MYSISFWRRNTLLADYCYGVLVSVAIGGRVATTDVTIIITAAAKTKQDNAIGALESQLPRWHLVAVPRRCCARRRGDSVEARGGGCRRFGRQRLRQAECAYSGRRFQACHEFARDAVGKENRRVRSRSDRASAGFGQNMMGSLEASVLSIRGLRSHLITMQFVCCWPLLALSHVFRGVKGEAGGMGGTSESRDCV